MHIHVYSIIACKNMTKAIFSSFRLLIFFDAIINKKQIENGITDNQIENMKNKNLHINDKVILEKNYHQNILGRENGISPKL